MLSASLNKTFAFQVIKVHQTSVDTYLESVILGSLDDTSDIQARKEIEEMADKINDVAYAVEEKYIYTCFISHTLFIL